jgi:hypothetical protein
VRKLNAVVVGAIVGAAGLLPTAASAEPTPTPTTSTSTPTATPTSTPTGTPKATPTGTPTATPTSTSPSEPGDLATGTMSLTPDHGAPGTVTTAKSVTPCVVKGVTGKVAEVALLDGADFADSTVKTKALRAKSIKAAADVLPNPVQDKFVSLDKAGNWSVPLTVPKTAKVGDIYIAIAICGPSVDQDATMIYDAVPFVVTSAPQAPVATPVPGKPSYTG